MPAEPVKPCGTPYGVVRRAQERSLDGDVLLVVRRGYDLKLERKPDHAVHLTSSPQ